MFAALSPRISLRSIRATLAGYERGCEELPLPILGWIRIATVTVAILNASVSAMLDELRLTISGQFAPAFHGVRLAFEMITETLLFPRAAHNLDIFDRSSSEAASRLRSFSGGMEAAFGRNKQCAGRSLPGRQLKPIRQTERCGRGGTIAVDISHVDVSLQGQRLERVGLGVEQFGSKLHLLGAHARQGRRFDLRVASRAAQGGQHGGRQRHFLALRLFHSRSCSYSDIHDPHEHPVVLPHVSHFMQVPFRTKVKFPHSPHASPS